MKLHFMKRKGSKSDLQVVVSGCENKVTGTESDKKFSGKWALRKVLCMVRTKFTINLSKFAFQ